MLLMAVQQELLEDRAKVGVVGQGFGELCLPVRKLFEKGKESVSRCSLDLSLERAGVGKGH